MISLIVSAYDRPAALRCCLASLAYQTLQGSEIIVACNTLDKVGVEAQAKAVLAINPGIVVIWSGLHYKTADCYDAAELVVNRSWVHGDWLGFPSDDSYYTPFYLADMLDSATRNNWDFVYSDVLHSSHWLLDGSGPHPRGHTDYEIMRTEPRRGRIDKTCFLIKTGLFREVGFLGFLRKSRTGAGVGGPRDYDGQLAEELVRRGVRMGKAEGGAMVVHS